MCGIAAIVAFESRATPTREVIEAMCESMIHRGPDDMGIDIRGQVGMGMRRLSIIDVGGGHQPIYNEDRSVCVVFNGEIYNFRELRCELKEKGHHFTTETDTEVIVHLYEEEGAEFPGRLNGMFAIVLHDSRRGRVIVARDHLGIKPVYYAQDRARIIIGSEVKVCLATNLVERRVDLDAVAQFLSWEYVPAPATLFKSVRKLEAGTVMEIGLDSGSVRIRKYWDIPNANGTTDGAVGSRSDAEWEQAVDDQLRLCVRRQLVSDVPLGAFLSGGVDSSLIVAAMGEARTFSIGFDDPTYNEVGWSQRVARHLGVNHTVEVIRPDIVNLFDHLMHFMDDPIADVSVFPTYLVSRLARQEVKVVLSGDGGDELFGGYETYLAQEKANTWMRLPAPVRQRFLEPLIRLLKPASAKKGPINKLKRFVEGLEHSPVLGHARWRLFVGCGLRDSLFTCGAREAITTPVEAHIARLFDKAGERDPADRSLYVDMHSYLVDNCLVKLDRMSMACSIESRVPFLDREMVELAFRIPSRLKFGSGRTKLLLKRVACRHVPRDCVHRPKEGFSIPIKHWLRTEFRPLVRELLDPARLRVSGLFEPSLVARMVQEHEANRSNHSHVLWGLLVFEDWRRRWKATL